VQLSGYGPGLHIERFAEERQPGVLTRRIHGIDRNATDEEVVDYYTGELAEIGGESVGVWKGSIALIASDGRVFSESYSFEVVLTYVRKGDITPGAPLDVITVDPVSGLYYSEMSVRERPDLRRIADVVGRHIEDL